MNRRQFLVGSTTTLLIAAAGGSFALSSCPLDTDKTGICTGPCTAFIDLDRDGFCDRVPPPALIADTGVFGPEVPPSTQRRCPFGLINDPYPGQCYLYVDADNDGICDLSQDHLVSAADSEAPFSDSLNRVTAPLTVCPLGLVNDPYPGECRRYVDDDNNGICDLSEPALVASGKVAPPTTPLLTPAQSLALEPDAAPFPQPETACPYGLVNDPYPGECRHYVDSNGNGICDLSEPELVASSDLIAPSTITSEHTGNGQRSRGGGQGQQRRGQNNQ